MISQQMNVLSANGVRKEASENTSMRSTRTHFEFFVGEDEGATTAPLEREVGNSIDDRLEDDTADPQFSEHPRLVVKEERRDDVVPPRVSPASDLSVLAVERFLRGRFERCLLDRLEKACSCGDWGDGGGGGVTCCAHLAVKRVPDSFICPRQLEERSYSDSERSFLWRRFHLRTRKHVWRDGHWKMTFLT